MPHPSSTVYVFRWWDTEPVFHFRKPWRGPDGTTDRNTTFEKDGRTWRRQESLTICGRPLYTIETWGEWPYKEGRGAWVAEAHAQYARLDHAEKYARRCQRCWAGLVD